MIRRLLSAILALLLLGAPLSVDLCQITCAAAEARTTDTAASGHSCHDHSVAAAATATGRMTAIPHGCGHDEELPAGSAADTLACGIQPALTPIAVLSGAIVPPLNQLAFDSPVSIAPPGADGRAFVPLRI